MNKKTMTAKASLPRAKPLTLLDFAELIVLSEKEKQDLKNQIAEIAAAVPQRQPLLSVIKNLRAAALQARIAIRNHLDHQQYDQIELALKSLEAHAL